jgi:hypothetical protein
MGSAGASATEAEHGTSQKYRAYDFNQFLLKSYIDIVRNQTDLFE